VESTPGPFREGRLRPPPRVVPAPLREIGGT
jgi:hypothetical protein